MLSSSLEEYLITIYNMHLQDKELKSSEVSKVIGEPLKKTVQALQRMHYQKYIIYLPYQPLTITDKGREMAKFLISRNELIEEFLNLLQITENFRAEKETMQQYFSYEMLEAVEKLILFMHQYPEVLNRYKMFSKRTPKNRLLEKLSGKEDQ